MNLQSIDNIFEKRILRIPDYQRGYSWQEHQLEDFWEDLLRLDSDKVHYTGVVTLEPVKAEIWKRWEEDRWLIDERGFKAFYIVDGQQRISTSIILIQAILESFPENSIINHQSLEEIKKQYILYKAPDGQRQSFLFGYEKDNPSYEFLKTKIFENHSHSNLDQQTLYTRNLEAAKIFFKKKLKDTTTEDAPALFRKLTQKFKFNLYEISDEVDVFVTFETMNNRGKPLTSLELLKNRLIYLSTLFKNHAGKEILRNKINDVWRSIYEYLGKNPDAPLSDDLFLYNHWIMYFKYSRRKGNDYIDFLLDEKFTAKNITKDIKDNHRITVEEIEAYITNLQKSIKPWFYIHNPSDQTHDYNDSNKILLERLHRLGFGSFKPLLLAAYVSNQNIEDINKLLKVAERYNFTLFSISQKRSNTGDSELFRYSRELLEGKITIQEIIEKINEIVSHYFNPEAFFTYISEKYKINNRKGFYDWDDLKYFLFENEQHLRKIAKQSFEKLNWQNFNSSKKDCVTIEHIFPQTATNEYWKEMYKNYNEEEKLYLTHSLGNLLPLSRAKNSSLQNDPFILKKDNSSGVGYYNGSISENEVNKNSDWDAKNILQRGVILLEFMEERWDIILGNEEFKKKLLHLEFLKNE
jgi:uncharacterized protein with ParB-like and HNH nuclease domain